MEKRKSTGFTSTGRRSGGAVKRRRRDNVSCCCRNKCSRQRLDAAMSKANQGMIRQAIRLLKGRQGEGDCFRTKKNEVTEEVAKRKLLEVEIARFFTLELKHLAHRINTVSVGAAPGMSGWRNRH